MKTVWYKERVVKSLLGLILLGNTWAFAVWILNIPICVNAIVAISLGLLYAWIVHYFWPLWRLEI